MVENTKIPAIRFAGFTEAWEQRKLGEMCEITTGKLDANAMVQDGQFDFYTSGIDVYKIDKTAFEGPAITIAGNGANVGYMHLADGKFNAYQRTYVLTGFLADRQFLNVAIGNELPTKIQEEVRGSGIPYIVLNMLTELNIPFPSHNEQKKIGQYFCSLDHLITLHQRKYEKLSNVKKSMLEKMFPKNGSNVPEIRFKGFTEAWEQRKFDEVFDCTIPNNTLSRAELNYESGAVRNIHYGDILIKYGSVVDVQNEEMPFATGKSSDDFKGALLQDGDIIIADTAEDETTGKACEISNSQGFDIVSGLHTMVCRPRNKIALGYLGYYLNSDAYHHQLLPLMQGIKVLSLSKTNVQKTKVCYPKSRAEQQLIANYFHNLDHLITLHQRKLEKLKNIKKSMLEKMFI
ncbi:MAG TPA: restriction endonuclease subunit S [Lachnospiraceae bacterium]